jgi:hypothetical protein
VVHGVRETPPAGDYSTGSLTHFAPGLTRGGDRERQVAWASARVLADHTQSTSTRSEREVFQTFLKSLFSLPAPNKGRFQILYEPRPPSMEYR